MLKGHFENCYGLENFDLLPIPFTPTKNKAIIYAPNGVMKSSLATVFDNLSRKKKIEDRIFSENKSSFEINYYDDTYTEKNKKIVPTIYVVNSFDASFEAYSDSVSTILADEELKAQYALVIDAFAEKLKSFIEALQKHCSPGFAIEEAIIEAFGASANDSWDTIIKLMETFIGEEEPNNALASINYDDVFNAQTLKVIAKPDFAEKVRQYVSVIDSLLKDSRLFNGNFDDYNAREFGNTVAKTQLFDAKHKILLSDGTIISSVDEWKSIINKEMSRIQEDESIQKLYGEIDKALNANIATRKLREIIKNNRMILTFFDDINLLKKRLWVSYASFEDIDIRDLAEAVRKKEEEITQLNEKATQQLQHWKHVIDVFTKRFRAPFTVTIDNENKVIFKGEPAHLRFEYKRNDETRSKTKEELMSYMSVGEKRALYLLQILFDLEKIKASTQATGKKHLVIADDIADSFDYTNKYAIIEYLDELSQNMLIDVLILTHNFDFYRTVSKRLDIGYDMCFVAQKDSSGVLSMEKFAYKNDYFTKGILQDIRNGKINDDYKLKKKVIASIPFCRNVAEYLDEDTIKNSLTSLLHIKPRTLSIKLSEYWDTIKELFNLDSIDCPNYIDRPVIDLIFDLAEQLVAENTNTVSLEDKLVMSIAIRLKTEIFLKKVLVDNDIELECSNVQTRIWTNRAKSHVTLEQYDVLNTVSLITPENIHVNAFMYEPLIDIPNWQLYDLYRSVKEKLI